jgi:hypothetical protein
VLDESATYETRRRAAATLCRSNNSHVGQRDAHAARGSRYEHAACGDTLSDAVSSVAWTRARRRRAGGKPKHHKIADMMLWRLALLVALYIAVDVTNPLMPGALVFDADASVEAHQSGRFWATDDAPPPAPLPACSGLHRAVATSTRQGWTAPPPPRFHVRHARLPRPALSPPAEDDPPAPPSLI